MAITIIGIACLLTTFATLYNTKRINKLTDRLDKLQK